VFKSRARTMVQDSRRERREFANNRVPRERGCQADSRNSPVQKGAAGQERRIETRNSKLETRGEWARYIVPLLADAARSRGRPRAAPIKDESTGDEVCATDSHVYLEITSRAKWLAITSRMSSSFFPDASAASLDPKCLLTMVAALAASWSRAA
jgi:hypothetical protein